MLEEFHYEMENVHEKRTILQRYGVHGNINNNLRSCFDNFVDPEVLM